jgi:hypothetical protein
MEKNPPLDPWNQPYQWTLHPLPQVDGTELIVPVVWSAGPNGVLGPEGELSSIH